VNWNDFTNQLDDAKTRYGQLNRVYKLSLLLHWLADHSSLNSQYQTKTRPSQDQDQTKTKPRLDQSQDQTKTRPKPDLRPCSKSSLTLNEWRFNLSFSWVSLLFLISWRVSSRIVTLQLFKNSTNTQEKLRLNLHSLSVSELLEYGRSSCNLNTASE
jgi:hypothetical protein